MNFQRNLWAAFGGLAWRAGAQDLTLHLRHDVVAGRSAPTSANLAWGYIAAPGFKLIASLANAFSVAPLGYLYDTAFGGNPDLKPERARSAELGAQWSAPGQRLRATLFRTRVAQEIAYNFTSNVFENIPSTRNSGLELSWDAKLSATDLRASLTAQNPTNDSTGQRLVRRSKAFAAVSATQAVSPGLRLGTALRYAGDRLDNGGVVLPAYVLADLTAQWDWSPALQVFGRIENLGDSHYQTAKGYNAAPRGVFVGLRWTPAGR